MLGAGDLVLCSASIRQAPFDVTVRAAAAAGFQGVSLFYAEYAGLRSAGWSDVDICRLLDDYGLVVAEMDGPMRWLPGDVLGPKADEFVRAAAALGARSVTVIEVLGRLVGSALSLQDVAHSFGVVCDLAAAHRILAHVEYFPFSGIADLATAFEVVSQAGRPNGGILLDTWHHMRGPDAGGLILGDAGSAVIAVQVSDVKAEPDPDVVYETLHQRLIPGDGVGALPALLTALRTQGCTAPMEIEVISDELAALDPNAAAQRCADGLKAVLA